MPIPGDLSACGRQPCFLAPLEGYASAYRLLLTNDRCPMHDPGVPSMLKFDVACLEVKQAFRPLTCVIAVLPYSDQVSFRVLDARREVLYASPKFGGARMCGVAYLRRILEEARSELEHRGIKLDAWNPPSASLLGH